MDGCAVCDGRQIGSWSGKFSGLAIAGTHIADWSFDPSPLARVLFSGKVVVQGWAYKNKKRIKGYKYDKRVVGMAYHFHSTLPVPSGLRSGDNVTFALVITGKDDEGHERQLNVSFGCNVK